MHGFYNDIKLTVIIFKIEDNIQNFINFRKVKSGRRFEHFLVF